MGARADAVAWERTVRRRRLGVLAAAGLVVVAVAAGVDAVRDRLAPGPQGPGAGPTVRDEPGEQAAAAPPWVWQGPVTPAELPAPAGAAPVITRVETTDPVVFLTIDDGHTRTPEAAAALDQLGIPATLFLVDGPVEADAGWFAGLPGAVVESHTRTHPDMTTLSGAAQRDEICGNAASIEQAFGRRPVLFRPPYGNYDESTTRAAAACGMRAVVLWQQTVNGDAVDFREAPRFQPGDIVLMHFRPSFVQELEVVKEHVHAAGLRFALLEDYLAPATVTAG